MPSAQNVPIAPIKSMSLIFNIFTCNSGPKRTVPFPFAGWLAGRCGSIASACLSAFFLLHQPLYAAQTASTQIERSISSYIDQQVTEQARQQSWQQVRHTLQINHIGKPETLPPCTQALRLSVESGTEPDSRQRLQLSCADTPGWSHSAFAQATIYLMVVHAASQIERGNNISLNQLKLAEAELSKIRRGYFQSMAEVSSQGAKRRIRAGQLITPSLLSAALMIRRGEAVTIRASQDGISAATKGQAMANGRAGEVIRVRNLSSEKVIDAQVIEPGVVSSTFH